MVRAAFDGRYVFLVPNNDSQWHWLPFVPGSVVERFEARSSPCVPNGWRASFF